jgi:hypothetical protein
MPQPPRVPRKPWKFAVTPSADAPPLTPPSLREVANAYLLLLALCCVLLATDAFFRGVQATARTDPLVGQALTKAIIDRNVNAYRSASLPVVAGYKQAVEDLNELASARAAGLGVLGEVLHDKESSFEKLHTLIVFALLVSIGVVLGVFLYRLFARLGIVDPALMDKIKEFVKGGSAAKPAGTGSGGLAGGTFAVSGLAPLTVPLALVGGAVAATLVLSVQISKPDPVPLTFEQPKPLRLSLETVPVKLESAGPVSTTVTFTSGAVPMPHPGPARDQLVRHTGTFALNAAEFTDGADKLAKATTDLVIATKQLQDRDKDLHGQIQKLTEASWLVLGAAYVSGAEARELAAGSVSTQFRQPRGCSNPVLKATNPPAEAVLEAWICHSIKERMLATAQR